MSFVQYRLWESVAIPSQGRLEGDTMSGIEALGIAVLKKIQRGEPREIAGLLLANRKRLDQLAQWYTQERLGVSLYAMTSACGLVSMWPGNSRQLMEDQYRQQQTRTNRLLDTLNEIDRAFAKEGIEYQLLKGFPLAVRYYSGVENRFTWDLDILVQAHAVPEAVRAFEGLGLRPPSLSSGMLRSAQWVTHALECKGDHGVSVDLHWAFRRLPGVRFPAKEVFNSGSRLEISGGYYPVPSGEYLLVQLLMSIAADVDRGRCRWRALWDTFLVIQSFDATQWDSFLDRRTHEGSLGLIAQAFALVVHSTGTAEDYEELLRKCAERLGSRRELLGTESAAYMLSRAPGDFRNHIEFARWQDQPCWRYWCWWAATLPARAFFARRL